MGFVLKGTFIDQIQPRAATHKRSHSEPRGLFSTSPCALFDTERMYVAMLETRAGQPHPPGNLRWSLAKDLTSSTLTSLPSTPSSPYSSSHGGNTTPSLWTPTDTVDDLSLFSLDGMGVSTEEPSSEPPGLRQSEGRVPRASHNPVATAACDRGSAGHPMLCKRPCIHFARGNCTNGAECAYCHGRHAERERHLDKRNRTNFQKWHFRERMALALPIMKRQLDRFGLTEAACDFFAALEADLGPADGGTAATPGRGPLSSALGALSFRQLMLTVCKPADTPAWLQGPALEESLERIRDHDFK